MPPEDRLVPRFAAEPPQAPLASGPHAERLLQEFLSACLGLDADLGEPGQPVWFPDRTWGGRTYVPVTCRTSAGLELYGAVSYAPATDDDEEDDHFRATADWTEETADNNPEWAIDLNEEVVGGWRGENDEVAAMTLVWGVPLVERAAVATAELGGLTVDQCRLVDYRFTLLAPDEFRGDTLDVAIYDTSLRQLARESLWSDDGEDDEDDDDEA
jgi:hypothetical protein